MYAQWPQIRLAPTWLDGREVIVVFDDENGDVQSPSYFMRLEWNGDRITLIRDYRYVRYVAEAAEYQPIPS